LSYEAAFFISYLPLCPSILGIVSALAGVVLGVISLTRKEPRRAFAIAGIVLGILTGLAMCIVTFILLAMSRT
jgi:Zn-dependent protease with chaperone function